MCGRIALRLGVAVVLIALVAQVSPAQSTAIVVRAAEDSMSDIPQTTSPGVLELERRMAQQPAKEFRSWQTIGDLVLGCNRLIGTTNWDQASGDELGLSLDSQLPSIIGVNSWHSYLQAALEPLGLDYTWTESRILIATPERTHAMVVSVTYDVTSVCVDNDFDTLIDLTTATVAPDSWDDVGGEGSIQGYLTPNGKMLLVISQTMDQHMAVRDLLRQIVTLESRRPEVQRNGRRRDATSGLTGSTVVAVPDRGPRRGIGLPNSGNQGGLGGMFNMISR
ncbi:MAG: hypothetical protein KDB23_03815 [Planctomycetales bacterium]|nr:hypothetical protein [Planctomycetales bacterium]